MIVFSSTCLCFLNIYLLWKEKKAVIPSKYTALSWDYEKCLRKAKAYAVLW